MHLFEAALAWIEVDTDPVWRELAEKVFTLCRDKFVDKETGLLAEQFDSDWPIPIVPMPRRHRAMLPTK